MIFQGSGRDAGRMVHDEVGDGRHRHGHRHRDLHAGSAAVTVVATGPRQGRPRQRPP